MTAATLGMALGICDVCGKAKDDGSFISQNGPLGAFSPLLAVAMGVCECPPVKLGPQEPPDDPRIFNRRQPDGSFRPLSEFFEPDNQAKCRTPGCHNPAEDGLYCHTCVKVVDDIHFDRGAGMAPNPVEP